ncbi:GNAT family N-acetyltransferase [Bifidobacterium sp. MA2]|uniref:GNAT family N-acetyltransferase n=1 Tax=Bifidobacterium santillanense TaxID=2809028 RepID=A0ABS5UP94_9BIFI|nr:GNAT family N-acetyltransferase [Bifidobacterium santillanense]MBT1172696.1 GNAT family N-acetyltransferase [Bifidobacterium santillanense]
MPARKKEKPRAPKLRRPLPEDLPDLYRMYSDPRMWWNQPGAPHKNIQYTKLMLNQWLADWRYEAIGLWVARDAIDRFLGVGGVRRCGKAWSLRYCVSPQYWHCGYGTYLASAGVAAAQYFDKDLPVFLATLRDNFTSCLIADKLDFVHVRNDFEQVTGIGARRIYANRMVSTEAIHDFLIDRARLLD